MQQAELVAKAGVSKQDPLYLVHEASSPAIAFKPKQ